MYVPHIKGKKMSCLSLSRSFFLSWALSHTFLAPPISIHLIVLRLLNIQYVLYPCLCISGGHQRADRIGRMDQYVFVCVGAIPLDISLRSCQYGDVIVVAFRKFTKPCVFSFSLADGRSKRTGHRDTCGLTGREWCDTIEGHVTNKGKKIKQ